MPFAICLDILLHCGITILYTLSEKMVQYKVIIKNYPILMRFVLMNKFHKRLFVLILFVSIISAGVIYFTVDINTLTSLTEFNPLTIIAALMSIGFGLFLDGLRLVQLVNISDEKISFSEALHVVFGNYFLALLTPGFSGGAIAQVLFLRHAGIPVGKATIIVIVRTILSIMFLIMCMPFIFMHDAGIIPWISDETLMIISSATFLGILLLIWCFKRNYLDYLVIKMVRKLSRKSPKKAKKFIVFYRDNKLAVKLLLASPVKMLKVYITSGLSLIFIYAIVPILMFSLTDKFDVILAMGRMIILNILLYFSPTPGGSGIAEGGFILLFNGMLPEGTVGIVAVSWRLIAEYIPFLIGFYYTLKVFGIDFLNKPFMNK